MNASRDGFAGTWVGEGRIIVAWCEKKYLSFELRIDLNGNVQGKIGDARIQHGKMRLNHIIYRLLGNREYVIDAELSTFLIGKEKIKRDTIRIFLDFKKPFLIGGFHTSGSKFGGKEKMVLSGVDLKLAKGSRKNKIAILSVEAPGWQGAKARGAPKEMPLGCISGYGELSQRSQAGCIGA